MMNDDGKILKQGWSGHLTNNLFSHYLVPPKARGPNSKSDPPMGMPPHMDAEIERHMRVINI
jgi:hypothetical protein